MTGKTPSQVFQWFSDQLAGVFPDWVKAMFFGAPMATEVRFSNDVKTIVRRKGQLIAPENLLQIDGPETPPVPSRIVDALIPDTFLLKRKVEAPATAGKKLKKLVALDMVRRTPFRPDTVYWAISKPQKSGNTLHVEQWIIKRSDIARLQQRAAKAGLHIRKVFVEGAPIQHPIADLSASVTPNARRWRVLNSTLAIGAVGLAAMVWLYPAWQASVENTRLNETIAQNRTQALAIRQEVEDLRTHEMERAAFLDIVYQGPRLSHVLRDITVALPDSVWVSDMNFSPERVVISGEVSGSAAQLVLALAQRNEFHNPRLSGPVSRANNGAERFELALDLVRPK